MVKELFEKFNIIINIILKGCEVMAQMVDVTFKLDSDVKRDMEDVCREMGLTVSAAFKIFAKKVGRERRIPFEVSADPFYSESNMKYLEGIARDIKAGRAHFAEHELIED